ncbi:MAG: lipopolysaccharide transport periplasmic protein LptA [Campylobacterales bacterium]
MMKAVFTLFALFLSVHSADIDIESKSFYANEAEGFSRFSGDVEVTQGEQWIRSEELFVYFDKNQKPTKLEAKGSAEAYVILEDGRKLDGSAVNIILYPNNKVLELIGGAVVKERGSSNQVSGEKIVIDRSKGETRVVGSGDKPARFTIEVEDD